MGTLDSVTPRYRTMVLFALMGVSAFNFLDRQILIILQESVKKDLSLSDTQLGLLTGFAFSVFYVTLGIPLARMADRISRSRIIVFCLGGWSIMTAFSGLAQNYWQLLIARIGVGIGEAGGAPPAHSLISDYFPPNKRSTALAIFSLGIYLGVMLGLLVGGILDKFYGWRIAFLVAGVPGFMYAVFLFFFLKEPRRGQMDKGRVIRKMDFWRSIGEITGNKTFLYLSMAGAMVGFVQYGVGNWIPPFLSRYHAMDSMSIGLLTAFSFGIGGALGTFAGGYMADRYGVKDKAWYFKIPMIGVLISIPFVLFICYSPRLLPVAVILIIPVMLHALSLAPSLAVAHNLVGPDKRALSSALYFFVLNLIGLGMGPLVVGFLSDVLTPYYGEEALRWALALSSLAALPAAYCFWKAAGHVRTEWIV